MGQSTNEQVMNLIENGLREGLVQAFNVAWGALEPILIKVLVAVIVAIVAKMVLNAIFRTVGFSKIESRNCTNLLTDIMDLLGKLVRNII